MMLARLHQYNSDSCKNLTDIHVLFSVNNSTAVFVVLSWDFSASR